MNQKTSNLGFIIFSFFLIYFVWGSAYIANALAVKVISPFVLAGIRFTIAGLIVLVPCYFLGWLKVTKQQLKNSFFAGFMLFAVGNGALVWSLQFIDSGLTCLITSIQPLIIVLMMWKMNNIAPTWNSWLGIILGITGTVFLVGQPEFMGNTQWVMGLIAILIAITAWSFIQLWLIKADLPDSSIQAACWQMLFGGLVLLFISILNGDLMAFEIKDFYGTPGYALIYLIIFASVFAFSAFNYLVPRVSPTSIAASTYVNPIVALFLGWWLNNEVLDERIFIAALFLFAGVFFINLSKKKKIQ